jgi:hypothetical protein
MSTENEQLLSDPDVQRELAAMDDSVWAINDAIERNDPEYSPPVVERNVEHLEIMLTKPEIIDSGADLTVYVEAIEAGNAYLENPPSV